MPQERKTPPVIIQKTYTGGPGLPGCCPVPPGEKKNLMRRAVRGREERQVRPLSWDWTRHPPFRPRKLAETRPCLSAMGAHKSDVQVTLRICFWIFRGNKQF